MKYHRDSTKTEWKIWYKLKKEETGLGWDDEKNTVVASDDWWTNYLLAYPDVAEFREKGIEYSYELTSLFKDGVALGNLSYAPWQGMLRKDNVGPCRVEDTQDTQEDANITMHNE
ncbi:uncharacterized protein At2g29880-like [Cornus florida]|uniref:uncharacterized protein At2g29880-like n=1 Tax=Cornus florida TaxID=4283 RepID=UPI0028A0E077|nr:uncharacterized protein At2g29880-like [Cornus florida]